jgi:hypothetical protein
MINKFSLALVVGSLISGCEFRGLEPVSDQVIVSNIQECPPLKKMINDYYNDKNTPTLLTPIMLGLMKNECLESKEYVEYRAQQTLKVINK